MISIHLITYLSYTFRKGNLQKCLKTRTAREVWKRMLLLLQNSLSYSISRFLIIEPSTLTHSFRLWNSAIHNPNVSDAAKAKDKAILEQEYGGDGSSSEGEKMPQNVKRGLKAYVSSLILFKKLVFALNAEMMLTFTFLDDIVLCITPTWLITERSKLETSWLGWENSRRSRLIKCLGYRI